MSTAVRLEGISKSFGSVVALNNVSLTVEKGQIHGLVGENGAGKTTLMRVLYGLVQPDSGTIEVHGQKKVFGSPKVALENGVGMVSQHYAIIPDLTCLQNLMLGAEESFILDLNHAAQRAQELATQMGFHFDWDQEASKLGPAGCQKLEILKLLWKRSEVLILDEPTAMLSPLDAESLFESLNQLTQLGKTVILVTHRLPEVLNHCQEVTVLRGGEQIISRTVEGLTPPELAKLIIGHELREHTLSRVIGTEPALQIQSVSIKGDRGDVAIKGANLTVHKGEVVGIAGVDGNGQKELFQYLMGLRKAVSGHSVFDGDPLDARSPAERIRAGIRLIAEDRYEEAMLAEWSMTENGVLGFHRFAEFGSGKFLDWERCASFAERVADRFNTRRGSVQQPLGSLSGGNQQRFIAARALELNPKLILAFQPTRGLDIDATRNVYDAIRELCKAGSAALVVSFDLDELLENCDRVVALNLGVLTEPSALDRDEIGRLIVGAV